MAGFEDFVILELPRRPFVGDDGQPGQALVRSANPLAPREMVWADIPGIAPPGNEIKLEAGEDLPQGAPVKVIANKFYAANQETDPHIIGITKAAALSGALATAVTGGKADLSGMTAGVPYYVGAGVITATAPTSGYLIRIGMAATASVLLVEIEAPILLT